MISLILILAVVLAIVGTAVPVRRPLHASERWFLAAAPLPVLLLIVVPGLWSAAHGWTRSGPALERASVVSSLTVATLLIVAGLALQWRRVDDGFDARLMGGIAVAAIPWLMIGLLYLEFAVLS